MIFSIPDPKQLADMLTSLLGSPITVKKGSQPLRAGPGILYSTFVTGGEETGAVMMTDLDFNCRSGAALALIPLGVAEEGIRAKCPSLELAENHREVMNVASTVLATPTVRARLVAVSATPAELAEPARAILAKPARRGDFEVDLGRYGKGKLSVLCP